MTRLLVNIDVDELQKAVEFYTTALPLRVGRRFGSAAVELLGAEAPIRGSNWGRLALLSDPFGHGFCLLEFKGRGYDEIATL
jgi:catechol 2,3-dioxygenase-like lactoylglutathione lyase family enzyme